MPRGECYRRHALLRYGFTANLYLQTTENNYKMLEFFLSIRFIYVLYSRISFWFFTSTSFTVCKYVLQRIQTFEIPVCKATKPTNVTWFQCVFMFDFPLEIHSSDHCKVAALWFQLWRQANLNFVYIYILVCLLGNSLCFFFMFLLPKALLSLVIQSFSLMRRQH